MPIGEVCKCFIREVGSYMWRDIAFDKDTWKEVSEAERVSLNNRIYTQYRGRKHTAKSRLTDFEWDVEVARVQAPDGTDLQLSSDVIDHFLTKKHQKRSAENKKCRKKQVVHNRGGTYSYGSACFKNISYNNVYLVNKKREFVDPLVEDQYNALVVEVALQTHHIADSGGDAHYINWIVIFEKVLGARRGHVRGIRPKPPSTAGCFSSNPAFVMAIGNIICSFKNQVNNEENKDGKGEDT
ncbi:unnamed protein product [Lactuca saligna]|uniref:Uncharacterized protein n=1 Tax=Lactuca saligna TaxID=75948 RepID=A0AA35US51_LACSI|nr:unnamed protein product [Lactuca saligna]